MEYKAVCITAGAWLTIKLYKAHWWSTPKRREKKGPKKDDIVTVTGEKWHEGQKWLTLLEWPGGTYNSRHFRPVQENFQAISFTQIKEKASVN